MVSPQNPPLSNLTAPQRKNMNASIKDGASWAVTNGLGAPFVTPFALQLGATAPQIGLLVALPAGITAVTSLLSAKVVERFGQRKRITTTTAFWNSLMWLILLSTPWLIPNQFQIVFVMAVFSMWAFLGTLPYAAWSSLMADTVPTRYRGLFWSRRNQIISILTLSATLFAGFFLGLFDATQTIGGVPQVFLGYAIIFAIACIARLISWYFLKEMEDFPFEPVEVIISPKKILQGIGKNEYLTVVFFIALSTFGMALATPFFAVYLLEYLHLDLPTFGLIAGASIFATFLALPYWARISDLFGRKNMLWVAAAVLPLFPLSWTFFTQSWQLLIIQLCLGFTLAGFNLNAFNFVSDASPLSGRPTYLSFYNFANNLALFLGGITGAILASIVDTWTVLGIRGIPILFLLSAAVTVLPVLWLNRIEEKKVHPTRNIQLVLNTALLLPSTILWQAIERHREPFVSMGALTLSEIQKLPQYGIRWSRDTRELISQTEKALEAELTQIRRLTFDEIKNLPAQGISISRHTERLIARLQKQIRQERQQKELKKTTTDKSKTEK